MARLCVIIAVVWMVAVPAQGQELRVVDGDSLEIGGQAVRLWGIDAPESRQMCRTSKGEYACGIMATRRLGDLIGASTVRCVGQSTDSYGRTLAICFSGAIDLNARMVREGWALAYRRATQAYVLEEHTASREKRGMWAGTFDPPWDWRHKNR